MCILKFLYCRLKPEVSLIVYGNLIYYFLPPTNISKELLSTYFFMVQL